MSTVPRHRIPKVKSVTCPHCGGVDNVSTVMSQAFAAGYHRRHICNECSGPFYTLTEYDGSGYQQQYLPFKDRNLSPWERQQRIEWAAEAEPVTTMVISGLATEFIETINEVFTKQADGNTLTDKEQILYNAINHLEKYWDNK